MYLDYSCKSPKCFCSVSEGPSVAEQPALGYLAALPMPGAFCIVRNPLWGEGKTQLSFIICNRLLTFLAPAVAAVSQFFCATCFALLSFSALLGSSNSPQLLRQVLEAPRCCFHPPRGPSCPGHPKPPRWQVKQPPVFLGKEPSPHLHPSGNASAEPHLPRQPTASPDLNPP